MSKEREACDTYHYHDYMRGIEYDDWIAGELKSVLDELIDSAKVATDDSTYYYIVANAGDYELDECADCLQFDSELAAVKGRVSAVHEYVKEYRDRIIEYIEQQKVKADFGMIEPD